MTHTEEIFDILKDMEDSEKLTLPPNSFKEMGGRVMEYVKGKSMKIAFPLHEKYENPAGIMLGGFLPVFFDLTFGPFSYLEVKKPTSSLDLNVSFIKPIFTKDEEVIIEVYLVNQSKSFIILNGNAYNPKNQLMGTATSRMIIMKK